MSESEPHAHPDHDFTARREEHLRAEIDELKQRLERINPHAEQELTPPKRPSRTALRVLFLLSIVAVGAAFLAGYLPRQKQSREVLAESKQESAALPTVNVTRARQAPAETSLTLPGSIQALTEAPVLARADGYLRRRLADIGDHVAAGQLLAEIEAPELDQQVAQARAAVQQASAAVEQANANLEQGRANQQLAKVTAQRWSNLLLKGAVSRQENDQYQAQYLAQTANVQALEKAVAAAGSNLTAAKANLERLEQLQGYKQVRAPFSGVITLRNVDTGALISSGQTLLFRIAQTGALRTYINVPQAYSDDLKAGLPAEISVVDFPGKIFVGRVARSSEALDPSSRTLLADVQVPNPSGQLLPGMYAQVEIKITRQHPPVVVPGDTVVLRPQGTMVAVVNSGRVHYHKITVGRDFGEEMEVLSGVAAGDMLVTNPSDAAREGAAVQVKETPARNEPGQ